MGCEKGIVGKGGVAIVKKITEASSRKKPLVLRRARSRISCGKFKTLAGAREFSKKENHLAFGLRAADKR